MYNVHPQIVADLKSVFARFALVCLLHLRDNAHRLVRKAYQSSDGRRGCIMYLLSELLGPGRQVTSRDELQRIFSNPTGQPDYCVDSDPAYQPAKWIVRSWDRERVPQRYGNTPYLQRQVVLRVLDEVIAERTAAGESAGASPRTVVMPRRKSPGAASRNRRHSVVAT